MILMVIVNLFKADFNVTPLRAQYYIAFIGMPMVFAFFYGLFSESIPLFGSHKRSYIIFMSAIQVATCVAITLLPVD